MNSIVLFLSLLSPGQKSGDHDAFRVDDQGERILIRSTSLEAAVRRQGYVSGIEGGSFRDLKTGFRDAGFGLDIVDFLMEAGSDESYRPGLDRDLVYEFNNLYHGMIAKRLLEGPQICTRAKRVDPRIVVGKDFLSVAMEHTYSLAPPGKKAGSTWRQTLVFPAGKRYFLSSDQITVAHDYDAPFFRIDMPGHIKHQSGDTFSAVYLSYEGAIPASDFSSDFPPDRAHRYLRGEKPVPKRFIRAYRLRDPATGKDGPWLAGMTLDPQAVSEAWCHQRGYVCMIEEIGGRKVKAGDSFGAAFVVGFFDSIEEMNEVYDRHAGARQILLDDRSWRLAR